ncbi:MAG TPA: amine oxidase, partial [Pseudorhodoferax sp.]|nr:amine oxidase [Pseudorhodoferax sp.]
TCSRADREGPAQAPRGDPVLRQSHWRGRLLFGGSETAAHGTGHMEGALDAAARLLSVLTPLGAPRREAHAASDHGALHRHDAAVAALRAAAPAQYRRHVTRLLTAQDSEALTQRALLATVEQAYSGVLDLLESLHPDLPEAGVPVQGRRALTSRLLAPFNGWNQALLQEALAFNGGSCALSNFSHEHRPDAALVRAITLDLAAAWREFALALNERLLTLSAEAPA